ncbi:hypothetical protein TSAR_010279 [Trichomalopsis sarcophagae]|uniref:Uncharacterized protein n=1 Tax=Trichomalopsis sarcophagae TaxID=543379 RepID=A0A232EGR5_9HYME|nr:hypothetical protein TSAR_010279 [Trichomalopsis sarcophagae]
MQHILFRFREPLFRTSAQVCFRKLRVPGGTPPDPPQPTPILGAVNGREDEEKTRRQRRR